MYMFLIKEDKGSGRGVKVREVLAKTLRRFRFPVGEVLVPGMV
jgi:hypothetical protein